MKRKRSDSMREYRECILSAMKKSLLEQECLKKECLEREIEAIYSYDNDQNNVDDSLKLFSKGANSMYATDFIYRQLIATILETGDELESRNHRVRSSIDLPNLIFTETPLVTLRKTAWKLALKEMEWFISGDSQCPEELLHWWSGQLNPQNNYFCGYGWQLRRSRVPAYHPSFDQIQYILNGLIGHPQSRRMITTTWNPWEMANITDINENKNCPTTCHGTITQFFVRKNKLHITTYQRSADMLLGVPHNWIQYWALLLWFAHHTHLEVGSLRWIFGDAHIYQHESHTRTAQEILNCPVKLIKDAPFRLVYHPSNNVGDPHYSTSRAIPEFIEIPKFLASDFAMEGTIPNAQVLIKPVLL